MQYFGAAVTVWRYSGGVSSTRTYMPKSRVLHVRKVGVAVNMVYREGFLVPYDNVSHRNRIFLIVVQPLSCRAGHWPSTGTGGRRIRLCVEGGKAFVFIAFRRKEAAPTRGGPATARISSKEKQRV